MYRQVADSDYVYFFSSVAGAWQASNLAAYNLTLTTLCGSQYGDVFSMEPFQAPSHPDMFSSVSYDPVIHGRNASNIVWFDAGGEPHFQSMNLSTVLRLTAESTVPLDRRGMLKMFQCVP